MNYWLDLSSLLNKYFSGLSFGSLCLQSLWGLLFTYFYNIDLTQQTATRNATWIWLSLVPTYTLALCILGSFYEKFHVWKKEGVVVGFVYDQSEACKKNLLQQKFKGSWTSHYKETVTQKDSRGQSPMWELLAFWIAVIILLIVFVNVDSA